MKTDTNNTIGMLQLTFQFCLYQQDSFIWFIRKQASTKFLDFPLIFDLSFLINKIKYISMIYNFTLKDITLEVWQA